MVREVGPKELRGAHDRDHLVGCREVSRFVVESSRYAEGAGLQPRDDERAHLLDLFVRRSPVVGTNDLGPHAVETNVGARVHGETGARELSELFVDVERTAAVSVEDLRRDALHEHVRCPPETARRRMAVQVDEAGRHIETAYVELERGARTGKVAHARHGAAVNGHVALVGRHPRAVHDRAAAQENVVVLWLGFECGNEG